MSKQALRVLVTGFNDWEHLGQPANIWRCRDNPSCRLLLGPPHDERPNAFSGPLVARLLTRAPEVSWSFANLPVIWESFAKVPEDVDVIINLGLGAERPGTLQLEDGAYNFRKGGDAVGDYRFEAIAIGRPELLEANGSSPVRSRINALDGRTMAGFKVVVARARDTNDYLCNETHFYTLSAVNAELGRLREAYFLHIPREENGDYEALAEGVSAVVLSLVE